MGDGNELRCVIFLVFLAPKREGGGTNAAAAIALAVEKACSIMMRRKIAYDINFAICDDAPDRLCCRAMQ